MDEQVTSDAVRIEVHEEPAWRRVIDVEVTADRVAAAYAEAYRHYRKEAKIPGFRPGKAPLEVIQRRFADEAHRRVLDRLVPETLLQAYREHGLTPISDPKLSRLELSPGEPMRYRAEIEIRPEIKAKDYTGLVLQKRRAPVLDTHVEETIQRIRVRRAEYETTAEPAARGDVVVCDLVETSGEPPDEKRRELSDITFELDPERLYPEIADGLLGVKSGDARQIRMRHPETHADPKLAGRPLHFAVQVKEVKARRLPELDGEFLKSLTGGIGSVDDLRQRVRADLEAQSEEEARRALNNEIVTRVVQRNDFELPASLIEEYLARLTEDIRRRQPTVTAEEVEAQYRELGTRQVRWEFLFHAIAAQEQITVTDADVDAWLGRFAENRGITLEQAKSELAGSDQVARIRGNLLEHKVLDFLYEKATITELPIETNLIQPPGRGPIIPKRK